MRDEVSKTHDKIRRERARSPSYRDYGVCLTLLKTLILIYLEYGSKLEVEKLFGRRVLNTISGGGSLNAYMYMYITFNLNTTIHSLIFTDDKIYRRFYPIC